MYWKKKFVFLDLKHDGDFGGYLESHPLEALRFVRDLIESEEVYCYRSDISSKIFLNQSYGICLAEEGLLADPFLFYHIRFEDSVPFYVCYRKHFRPLRLYNSLSIESLDDFFANNEKTKSVDVGSFSDKVVEKWIEKFFKVTVCELSFDETVKIIVKKGVIK